MSSLIQALNLKHSRDTFIAATIASAAAFTCLATNLPPWAMFVGWIVFFTRPTSISNTLTSSICVTLGILLGVIASVINSVLLPVIGKAAFVATVFIVAFIVVSLRGKPIIGNIAAWFLGLITFFAAHAETTYIGIASLIAPVLLGISSGHLCTYLQSLPGKNKAD
ncbi:DUF1097 domain-containing protein [Microbulbifer epialgicus]|uniref:DUF1097 domain-containing protein n=1 Tax=Microbulbifer epialgicus TaxID=393907 RepID=A0ABV4P3R5_9GAMM